MQQGLKLPEVLKVLLVSGIFGGETSFVLHNVIVGGLVASVDLNQAKDGIIDLLVEFEPGVDGVGLL